MTEERLQPRGERNEPEYTMPRINSQVAPSTVLHSLNEVEELSRECQLSTTDGTGHPGLATRKGRRLEKPLPSRGVMLNTRGECRTKALGGTGAMSRHQEQPGMKPEGTFWASSSIHLSRSTYNLVRWTLGISVLNGNLL